ncbi:glycosyltransferase family 4 protein [Neobacillus muris]|uniref:glycosyltransferase family 4 protein n=1 Tax=Neobacillus muris TaxID=2941334 RepID=UPI002040E676|nr:glycosyltransferase family 1 protein [Neobacillus muris]
MKIAIFTDTFYPDINGVAKTLKRLTDYLEEHRIEYKLFAPSSYSDEYVSSHIHRFKSLSFFLYPECRLAFPSLRQMKAKLQKFNPDLIHVATPFNIGLCGLYFAKKLAIPLAGSYHTNFDQYLQYYDLPFLSKILWKYMYWFHQPCQKLFVPSSETLQQLSNHGFTNLEIWPRGVDCQLFHPNYDKKAIKKKYGCPDQYLITYVGRLAPEKDIDTLLAIIHLIPEEVNQKIHWAIVGDGPLRQSMEDQGIANLTFTGFLNGVSLAEIYSASDLFVFPSPTETFGNVVLESLASGTPVIGADSGGVRTIVKSGVTGYLCQPGEAEEFTKAMIHLLQNDWLRAQMGNAGRNYALTQRWEQIFENLLIHYQDITNAPKTQKFA